ncbi:MAG: undecaprenyldiphospho-muramoylpentapeptide beta-N-acetylglucosaminyltransferase [Proteobacteria bacterium]|nr:undecaprenyldiphospho-muramoylpentapeptide beta-N-acetylglucosaminyltransferase [Pseudomonadota bacterium]
MTPRRIALAAGGTGGHVFPALSLADALSARGHQVFVLTDARGGVFDTPDTPWSVHLIRAASPSKPGLFAKLAAVAKLALGFLDARRVLKTFQIEAVVGFGGYPSVPAVIAGSWLNKPAVLHEQNAVLGRANRWLVGRADVVATSFDATIGVDGAGKSMERTGNPVRASVLARRSDPYRAPVDAAPIQLCVFGGSLGARVFSDLLPAALALLPEPLRARLRLTQQCRPDDLEKVRRAYDALGLQAEVGSFFDDVPARLGAAQLVIARAGASTLSELAVIGRPSILVPYPHAMDDHQSRNAAAMETAGGGWCLPEATLTAERLAERLEALLGDPKTLASAAQAAHDFGVVDAADRLADLVLRTVAARGGKLADPELDRRHDADAPANERRALA